jgi:hypothetical protein
MKPVKLEAKNQQSTIKKQKNCGKDDSRSLAAAISRGGKRNSNCCRGGQGNGGGQLL